MELGRAHPESVAAEPQKHSNVPPAQFIPRPPGWGPRVVQSMPLDEVFQYIPKNELFRLSWGGKNTHGEEWVKLEKEFEERLEKMRKQALKEGWLKPKGVYGYFPVLSIDNDLVIFEPGSVQSGQPVEWKRFNFPRQQGQENLCLADYFSPASSGVMDVAAFQVVTVGQRATELVGELDAAGNVTESYFAHGLAVQMAEAAAEFLHRHIRKELGLPAEQGKRYSWGYPAIPELSDHARVFELLPAESELGMSLTEAFQMVPEQSTAAIIVHHPQATYFNVASGRSTASL